MTTCMVVGEGSSPSVAICRKMLMLNAKEANAQSKLGKLDVLRKHIEAEIQEAIDLGNFSCRIDHSSLDNEIIRKEIMKELNKLEFSTSFDSGSSCRESYCHLHIFWTLE